MEESHQSSSSVNVTQNPFDVDSLDSLHLPQCSPSVFAIKQKVTPASTKKTPKFRWSIDQMAILHPVEIEELPYHQEESKLDDETESRIQAAIDTFFSQQQVVPSPWSEPKPLKRFPITPSPCSTNGAGESDKINKDKVSKPKTVNATCQTMLTLPMDFDLEALLGAEHYQYKDHDKSTDYEMMSTSSLRRKLFTGDVDVPFSPVDDDSPPVSPVKGYAQIDSSRESMPFIISSPPISPIRAVEDVSPVNNNKSLVKTPSSGQSQFSSSPIASNGTPLSRFSPSDRTQMESPCISPIGSFTTHSSTTSPELKKYVKSRCNSASLPDDTSMVSISMVESPIGTSSANVSRKNLNTSKSCPSSLYAMGQNHTHEESLANWSHDFHNHASQKLTSHEESLANWSHDFHNHASQKLTSHEESLANWSHDFHNHASQKLTSTMKLGEPMDSLGLSFEPRLCSSRLVASSQESQLHTNSGVVNSEPGLTTPDESAVEEDGCDSCDLTSDVRKTCDVQAQGAPGRFLFGPRGKMVGMEMMGGTNSDSGINTGSISLLEPTDMEGVEER